MSMKEEAPRISTEKLLSQTSSLLKDIDDINSKDHVVKRSEEHRLKEEEHVPEIEHPFIAP